MGMNEIMGVLESLARSQGFYARIIDAINGLCEDDYIIVKHELEDRKFKDVIDVVMYFECGV